MVIRAGNFMEMEIADLLNWFFIHITLGHKYYWFAIRKPPFNEKRKIFESGSGIIRHKKEGMQYASIW